MSLRVSARKYQSPNEAVAVIRVVSMQLTKFSDYALRVLMYTHAAGGRRVTIEELAAAYRISRAHLMKVVNSLARAGYLTTLRGRSGGSKIYASARWFGQLSLPLRLSNAFRRTINAWSPAVAGWRAFSIRR